MNRKAILLFAIICLAASGMAAYCDEAPSETDCQCRNILQKDASGNPIKWEDTPDITVASNWMNLYCSNNGKLLQKRTAFEIIKPECQERFEIAQYQEAENAICKTCPAPKLISSWQATQCAGTKTVYQREAIAYYFLPNVSQCELGRFNEIKTEETGPCASAGGSIILTLTNNWLAIIIVIAVIAIAAIAIILKKHKRR